MRPRALRRPIARQWNWLDQRNRRVCLGFEGLIEIVLPDGVTLRVDAQVDGRALRRVLGALEGR